MKTKNKFYAPVVGPYRHRQINNNADIGAESGYQKHITTANALLPVDIILVTTKNPIAKTKANREQQKQKRRLEGRLVPRSIWRATENVSLKIPFVCLACNEQTFLFSLLLSLLFVTDRSNSALQMEVYGRYLVSSGSAARQLSGSITIRRGLKPWGRLEEERQTKGQRQKF